MTAGGRLLPSGLEHRHRPTKLTHRVFDGLLRCRRCAQSQRRGRISPRGSSRAPQSVLGGQPCTFGPSCR